MGFSNVVGSLVKRALDVALSSIGLLVLAPVIGAAAFLVWWDLGRPVLFRQVRPGKHGAPFVIYKFRTMKRLDEVPEMAIDESDAVRLTRVGRLMRRLSLDELPELVNVLRGEMSMVGPRPLLIEYLPLYSPRQARRHEVKPGLTGLAQVSGRNALDWDERLELDVRYVENQSIVLDIKILLRTIGTVLSRRGVSKPGNPTMPRFRGSGTTAAATDES